MKSLLIFNSKKSRRPVAYFSSRIRTTCTRNKSPLSFMQNTFVILTQCLNDIMKRPRNNVFRMYSFISIFYKIVLQNVIKTKAAKYKVVGATEISSGTGNLSPSWLQQLGTHTTESTKRQIQLWCMGWTCINVENLMSIS